MGPVGHTVISSAVGAVTWGVTGSPLAGGIALGVGVLIDVDHLYDFYQWWIKGRPNKYFVFFHGWEYSFIGVLVLLLAFYHPFLLAVPVAHLSHVTTDHFYNRVAPLGYFILYRVWVRFDAERLLPGINLGNSYKSLPRLFPFRRYWEPWYRRKVEPWLASRAAGSRGGVGAPD